MRAFTSPDGIHWGVEGRAPGASNVMIVFHYPDKSSAGRDRYAWLNWDGPEARNVTARLDTKKIVDGLDEEHLALLFRRSMSVSALEGMPRAPTLPGASR
jgi:hypothetical protein